MNLTFTLCVCAFGEYMLENCTDESEAVCWPCPAGFACVGDRTKRPCVDGWSTGGSHSCLACSAGCGVGMAVVRACTATADRVCGACPSGFGCDGTSVMQPCVEGTYASEGRCVACPANRTSSVGSASETDCVCLHADCGGCGPGQVIVGGACRSVPRGYGLAADGMLRLCEANTYSWDGACASCGPNSRSAPGASSLDQCVCVSGYVKTADNRCSACEAGTVWEQGRCVLCAAGHYCVGKTHSERCPNDMWSIKGSAVCAECRPFSNCQGLCTDASNCTCDDGYVLQDGECRRCAPGTMKHDAACVACAPGTECLGGADVRPCELATYSPGNLTQCLQCTRCPEMTLSRCNATHDSACEPTRSALAVITVRQDYRTAVDGETFGLFAMVLASSLPRAQLLRVCGFAARCVDCFQGVCPAHRMRALSGPAYSIALELRSEAGRLSGHIDTLTQTPYLLDAAKTAMRKFTETPFTVTRSTVEHTVICANGATWDGSQCARGAVGRTWLGLAMGVIGVSIMVGVARYGGRKKGAQGGWKRIQADEDGE